MDIEKWIEEHPFAAVGVGLAIGIASGVGVLPSPQQMTSNRVVRRALAAGMPLLKKELKSSMKVAVSELARDVLAEALQKS